MADEPTEHAKRQAHEEEQAQAEYAAAALLRSKLRHPDYTPARERMNQWDDYHRQIDPDRG